MAKKAGTKDEAAQPKNPPDNPQSPDNRDIDQRMADLLKDHQEMGARPK